MKKKKERILLTGGAGYIGSVMIEKLLEHGYQVRVLDIFLFGNKHLTGFKNRIEIIKGDIRIVDESVFNNVDAVIHQAGLSNDPMAEYDPALNLKINTEGTLRIAKLSKKCGVKRFTFSSSASIYNHGILKRTRIQGEDYKVKPKLAYSLSKFQAEIGLLKLIDKDFCPIIIRQGTVYGFSPRMRYDLVVNTMIKTALSERKIYVFCGGVQWRPMIEINDVVSAHIMAVEAPENKVKGQIINLVYKNYRILDLAEIVKKVLEKLKKINITIIVDKSHQKDRSYKIAGNKIFKLLHWQPKISVEKSVINIVNQIEKYGYTDFSNPKYYNISWIKLLEKNNEKIFRNYSRT